MGRGRDSDRRGALRGASRYPGTASSLRRDSRPLQGAQAVRALLRAATAHALGQAAATGACLSFDANAYRESSLENWEAAASGWVRRQEALRELAAPVSHWMIAAIDPQPGQRVLELAAGLGETGMLAA